MNDRADIEALKASLSISQVAERLGHRVVHGKIRCPYAIRHAHGDRTPSVSLSESKGLFRCWVCPDVRGDVIRLVEISLNLDFKEAVSWLKEEFGGTLERRSSLPESSMGAVRFPVRREAVPDLDLELRGEIVAAFLDMLSPVEKSPAASWLVKRRIFKSTWDSMRLRTILDYDGVMSGLLKKFPLEDLQKAGLFNEKGNLRYYKHRLIFPYLDGKGVPRYFQARTTDPAVQPKELNLKGPVPFPYNASLLDGKVGWIYLCEGCVDTLTMISRGFPSVGIPGVKSFKPEWVELFRGKRVILCLDQDEAGRIGAKEIEGILKRGGIESLRWAEGIEAKSFQMAEGQDINSWFGGKK